MKRELLQQIAEYTHTANRVIVEAAHIYADQMPNGEQYAGVLVAESLLKVVEIPTHNLLFIDDYHPLNKTLDITSYHRWLAALGYPVDEVVYESRLVPEAYQLLAKIKEVVPNKKLSPRRPDGTRSIGLWVPDSRKVSLLTQEGKPSCNLLDASFYLKKAEMGDVALTVLPECYRPQQTDTLAILQRIGCKFSIINVFFNPENPLESVSVVFNRGQN